MVKESYVKTVEALSDDDMDDSDVEEDDEDSDDYDDDTEESLERDYTRQCKFIDFALNQLFKVYNLPGINETYSSKLRKQKRFTGVVILVNDANDKLKKLFEMGVDDIEMETYSQMQAHITTKMLELKEIVEGPKWNPALHSSE